MSALPEMWLFNAAGPEWGNQWSSGQNRLVCCSTIHPPEKPPPHSLMKTNRHNTDTLYIQGHTEILFWPSKVIDSLNVVSKYQLLILWGEVNLLSSEVRCTGKHTITQWVNLVRGAIKEGDKKIRSGRRKKKKKEKEEKEKIKQWCWVKYYCSWRIVPMKNYNYSQMKLRVFCAVPVQAGV